MLGIHSFFEASVVEVFQEHICTYLLRLISRVFHDGIVLHRLNYLLIYLYKATWKNFDFVWRLNGGYTFETGPSFTSLQAALGPGFSRTSLISVIWSVR